MRSRRLGTGMIVAVMVLAAVGVSTRVEAAVIRPFTPRFSLNTTGAIVMTGNSSLTCPTTAAGCVAARAGTGSTINNNNFTMAFIDIDGDPTTFNSSRNTLTIPATSTVAWAGLYWGADTTSGPVRAHLHRMPSVAAGCCSTRRPRAAT